VGALAVALAWSVGLRQPRAEPAGRPGRVRLSAEVRSSPPPVT